MLKQSWHLITYLLVSLVIGIAVTLVVDSIENIAVEKGIRKELEREIRAAAASYKDFAGSSDPTKVVRFLEAFSSSAMSGKIIAIDPARDSKPDSRHFTHLFTYAVGAERLEYYIVNNYLKEQLAILDPPELIFGLITTFAVFAGIIFYTEKRKQAQALRQQFEVKHEEIKKVLEEHEALALLGRMAATLAHEMKTPVATISNLVQVLPDRLGDERFTSRFVALTKEELARTQQLIDNLLAYGKEMEVGKGEWIPLTPFVDEIARKHALELQESPSVEICGDRFYLALLFDNLMRNCWGAGADRVRITIRNEQGGDIEICVEDNGSGFPAEVDLDTLLNPFITFHARGAGLGLYLASKIAAAHGGRISLYRPEQGAGVTITLPRERVVIHG